MEEKSVEAINKAKNDVKANKEKINNDINSKNTEINPEAKRKYRSSFITRSYRN